MKHRTNHLNGKVHASSWNYEDWHGNRSTVVGLGTAWSYDAIFKPDFKFLPKDEVDARRRGRTLEEHMYNELVQASGG